VVKLQTISRQLASRNDLVAKDDRAKVLIEESKGLLEKLDALEARMHNPKAEISYDILAMKGGAQLYSRLSPFFEWVKNGDGAPTQGMREVFAEQQKELAAHESELAGLINELVHLNELARGFALPEIYVP